MLLVLKLGINEWPMPGRIVRRETYLREYHELTHATACRSCRTRSGRTLCSPASCCSPSRRARTSSGRSVRRPTGPDDHPDGAAPGFLLPVALRVAVVPAAGRRNALPLDRSADHPRAAAACRFLPVRAKRAGGAGRSRSDVLLVAVSLGHSRNSARYTPWSPEMDAWSGAPVPASSWPAARRWSAGRAGVPGEAVPQLSCAR